MVICLLRKKRKAERRPPFHLSEVAFLFYDDRLVSSGALGLGIDVLEKLMEPALNSNVVFEGIAKRGVAERIWQALAKCLSGPVGDQIRETGARLSNKGNVINDGRDQECDNSNRL